MPFAAEVLAGVVAGLILAALIAAFAAVSRWSSRRRARRRPLTITAEVVALKGVWAAVWDRRPGQPEFRLSKKGGVSARNAAYQHLLDHGARPFHTAIIRLNVAGGSEAVVVTDIQVVDLHREAASRSVLIVAPDAGTQSSVELAVDLERPAPVVSAASADEGGLVIHHDQPFYPKTEIKLSPGESQTILVHCRSVSHDATWRFMVRGTCNGNTFQTPVPSGDSAPFAVGGKPSEGFQEFWDWNWYTDGDTFIRVDSDGLPLRDS
jgi:hypothetical protein